MNMIKIEPQDELEKILDEIESGEIDLDELSDKVERAATLLSQCRKKLAATETKAKKGTSELEAALDDQQDEEADCTGSPNESGHLGG